MKHWKGKWRNERRGGVASQKEKSTAILSGDGVAYIQLEKIDR